MEYSTANLKSRIEENLTHAADTMEKFSHIADDVERCVRRQRPLANMSEIVLENTQVIVCTEEVDNG